MTESRSDAQSQATPKVSIRAFWAQLSPAGRWLLSTVALQHLGRGMILPFTIVYFTEVRHVSLDTAGVLMGLIAVAALIVTGPGGALTDRFGSRHILIAATLCGIVSPLVLGLGATVPVFVVGICIMGVGWGAHWSAWNTLIATVVTGPARQQFFGINFALVNLGIGLGGVISGFFVDVHRPWTFTAVFVLDAICMMIPLALLLGPLRREGRPVPTPDDHTEAAGSYRALLRTPAVLWLAGLTFLTTFVGYGQMESGFPAFARQVSEVGTRTLGFAFAANTVVIVALQFAVLKRIEGHRRTRVLMLMSLIWALGWGVLGWTGIVPGTLGAAVGILAFMAVFGLGETMMQATIPALVNDLADDHTRGRANGLNSGAFQLGAIAGPVMAGFVLHNGHHLAFIVALVLGCGVVALSALGIERIIPPTVNGIHDRADEAAQQAQDQTGVSMPQVPVHD